MSCELVLMLGYFVMLVSDEVELLNTTPVAAHRNVVGYIGARFTPRVLRVSQDSTATGQVHVTVQSPHRFSDNSLDRRLLQPAVHACIVDPSVATASWYAVNSDRRRPTEVTACSVPPAVYDSSLQSRKRPEVATIYLVRVRGVLIGRSAVRFYVTKTPPQTNSKTDTTAAGMHLQLNSDVRARTSSYNHDVIVTPESSRNHVRSAQVQEPDSATDKTVMDANGESDNASDARVACGLSTNVTGECRDVSAAASHDVQPAVTVLQQWWLSDECPVVVVSPVQQKTANVLCYVLITLTAVNLVSIGGQLDCDEAIQLLRRPSSLAVGLFCRFAILPAVSLHR